MKADDFWGMSLLEISDYIDAYKKRKDYTEKIEAERLFVLAEAISTRVAFFLSAEEERSEDMVLMPWDVYPDMFEAEHNKNEHEKLMRDLSNRQANMQKYALAKNRKIEVMDNGDTT